MGFNDNYPIECFEYTGVCPYCGKAYRCIETEQTPGFRDTEEENCPYCRRTIRTSMEYEFTTFKIKE